MKRNNGTGSICFESKRNSYRVQLYDTDGKRITKRFKTRDEAERWLTTTRASMYNGDYIPKDSITLGDWMVEYIRLYCMPNVRQKTLSNYINLAKHIEGIAGIKVQELTAPMVQRFYLTLPDSMADTTKKDIHRLLKACMTKAVLVGLINKNPMHAVDTPRVLVRKDIEIFTVDEVNTILHTVKYSRYYSKYFPFIYLAVTTGMRLGELLALRYENVHSNYVDVKESVTAIGGEEVVSLPKTKAGMRKVTISSELSEMLGRGEGYVFSTATGNRLSIRNMERTWTAILKEAGIEHRKFHTLRHTHASTLIANGESILEVAKRLGHSRVSHTLNLYGHAMPDKDNEIPDKLNNIYLIPR